MCEQKIAIQFGLPCLGRNACDQQTNKTTNKRKRGKKREGGGVGWGAVLFHCKHIFYVVMLTIYSFLLSRQPSLLQMRYSHAVLILHNNPRSTPHCNHSEVHEGRRYISGRLPPGDDPAQSLWWCSVMFIGVNMSRYALY